MLVGDDDNDKDSDGDLTGEDFDLVTLSLLGSEDVSESDMRTTVYDLNRNDVAGLIVIEGKPSFTGQSDGLAFVRGISQIRDRDGAEQITLNALQGGVDTSLECKDVADGEVSIFDIIVALPNAKGQLLSGGI